MQIHQHFCLIERGTIRKSEGTFQRRLKVQLKIWYYKHLPSKGRKATKRDVYEDSEHELPGAKVRVVLPDLEEEDHAGGGARSPGRGDGNESD
jgi:hypothetical protein